MVLSNEIFNESYNNRSFNFILLLKPSQNQDLQKKKKSKSKSKSEHVRPLIWLIYLDLSLPLTINC